MIQRCAWAAKPEMWDYHDHEWGVPVRTTIASTSSF